jgi:tRNA A-37 threonylcarbamoyl transferase component Bud32
MTIQGIGTSRVALPGGVSCDVAIVTQPDGREIVVKQALARLKVAADWWSDPSRASVEVVALRTLKELLGDVVPEVLWEDAANHRFAMQRIHPSFLNWRDELNRRHVDLEVAARVGELLAQLHARSAARPDIAAQFANLDYFRQLRIEPFFLRIAQRNAHIASHIALAIDQLLAPGQSLVHGDFSPKNMLVRGREVIILDCEVAHWGNPQFDVAFCLMHLLLDGLHKPPPSPFADAAAEFLGAYGDHGGTAGLDADLVRITGCLMLARLEGDSPIDFREQLDVPVVKQHAIDLIARPPASAREAIASVLSLARSTDT